MCQRISSHQSLFLIFFQLVCTSEVVYLLRVTFHQRTGSDLTFRPFPLCPFSRTSHIISPQHASSGSGYKESAFSSNFLPHFRVLSGFAFAASRRFLLPYLPGFRLFGLCSGFSLPVFLYCASTWSCATGAASAQRTRFQPALKSQPAHGCLSVPGAATAACPYYSPTSAHLLYLSAGALSSIHGSPSLIDRTG